MMHATYAADAAEILRLRFWQHILNEMLKKKAFRIPVHLAFGYEALAVAVDRTLAESDVLCVSHRNAEYNLVRLKSLTKAIEHYQMAATSPAGPKMGSMNLAADGTNIIYASSILGNNLPVGAGVAFNRKIRETEGVVFVATGDGAMEEGAFWETMIFARSHELRLVVIVENNDYAMSSTIAERRSPVDLSKVCDGIGIVYA